LHNFGATLAKIFVVYVLRSLEALDLATNFSRMKIRRSILGIFRGAKKFSWKNILGTSFAVAR